jgi:hypothetical protein
MATVNALACPLLKSGPPAIGLVMYFLISLYRDCAHATKAAYPILTCMFHGF